MSNLKPAPFNFTEGVTAKLTGDRPALGKGVAHLPIEGRLVDQVKSDLPCVDGLLKIDDSARDGRYQLLLNGECFALCRWAGEQWVFVSGMPLDFAPVFYKPRESDCG